MTSPDRDGLARARELLAGARSTLVLTGAGISADSGVPTFRGPEGLWRRHRPEELATPEAFARDSRLVWEWYGWRRRTVAACRPNAAHRALAEWQADGADVVIATQNVDGLHALAAGETGAAAHVGPASSAAAGAGPPRLLEIHGTLFRMRCTGCGAGREDRSPIDAGSEATLPRCDACAALMRPDVVWFGEPLDPDLLAAAFARAEEAEVCLVIGTSAVVQPAASLAVVTRRSGGAIIEVNPEETPLTPASELSLRGGAAALVPEIVPRPSSA